MAENGQRRPTDEDFAPLLELIWDGKSLRAACRQMGLHTPSTSDWLTNGDPRRREQYMRAREGRAEFLQEEALTINRAAALAQTVDGKKVEPAGARGYLDAIKWATAKMAPKTHGDTSRHEHTGAGGGPIQTVDLSKVSDDDLRRLEHVLGTVALAGRSDGAEGENPAGATEEGD